MVTAGRMAFASARVMAGPGLRRLEGVLSPGDELVLGCGAESKSTRRRLNALRAREVGALGLQDSDVAARGLRGALLGVDLGRNAPRIVVEAIKEESAGDANSIEDTVSIRMAELPSC